MKEYLRDKYLKEIKEVLETAKRTLTDSSYEMLIDNVEDYIEGIQARLKAV
jgi:hypothetical protein